MRPYLRAANVGWDGLKLDDVFTMNFTDAEMSQYRLEPGDILLSEASGSALEVGKPALWEGQIAECAFQNTLIRVRPRDHEPRYLLHYFKWLAASGRTAAMSRGVGIYHLGQAAVAEAHVPQPPLDEQRRIAAVLDQTEGIRAARLAVVQKLDQLADAAFEASFGEGTLSGGCHRPLASVLTGIVNGRSPKCESRPREGGEWGVLKLGAVSFGRYQPAENKAYLGDVLATDKVVEPGDVLMVRKNTPELVGAVAHVHETPAKLLLPDLVFRLEYDEAKVVGEYLRYALMAPRQRAAVRALASGSARSMSNISIAKLRTVQIPVPAIDAQLDFTLAVRQIENQREVASQSLGRFDMLRQALQGRAFNRGL